MRIRIDEIKDKPRRLSAVEEVSAYPSLSALVDAGECTFLEPLRIQLTVAREFDHIRVEGTVETRAMLSCSRCLAEYEASIAPAFTVFYIRSSGSPDSEEVELSEQDLVSVTLQGDEIDFTDEIANQVFMEIPIKPLCNDECKGLCPRCGSDLNMAECGCGGGSEPTSRFAVLKNLKIHS